MIMIRTTCGRLVILMLKESVSLVGQDVAEPDVSFVYA